MSGLLTLDEVNELIGDDVAFWLDNPFLDRAAIVDKVRFWVTTAEARGAERALREAADALEGGLGVVGIPQTLYDTRIWLRDRAAQVAPSRVPGEES